MQRITEVFLLKCSDVMTNECQVFQKSKLLGERIFNDCVSFMALESKKSEGLAETVKHSGEKAYREIEVKEFGSDSLPPETNADIRTAKNGDETISLGNPGKQNLNTIPSSLPALGETPNLTRSATRMLPRMPKSLLSQHHMAHHLKVRSNGSSVKTFSANQHQPREAGEIKSINLAEPDHQESNKIVTETSPRGLMVPVNYNKNFGSQTITAGFKK